jgi:hypothetical protein
MLKNILNLEGVFALTKEEQKRINGSGTTCKATCNDGSIVTVSSCSDAGIACSGTANGSSGCSCNYPSPFDKPKVVGIG